MLKEYARLIELCQDMIQWLEDEHSGLVDDYVKDYIMETYPDLYHKIFGYEDD